MKRHHVEEVCKYLIAYLKSIDNTSNEHCIKLYNYQLTGQKFALEVRSLLVF